MKDNLYNRIWKKYQKQYPKYYFFMFRNNLRNSRTDFSEMDEETFKKKYCEGSDIKYGYLLMWESSDEYRELQNEVIQLKIDEDINKIYKVVREKALEGDEKAIKTLLLLKNELKISSKKPSKQKKDEEEQEEKFDLS